jgi:hypothetical protein
MKIRGNKTARTAAISAMLLISGLTGGAFSEEKYQFPEWINRLIEKEKAGEAANPPASLSRCKYKGQTVYYRPPRCCDISSSLYDENGNIICSPDGGFTGRGDGKCPDFFYEYEKRECEVIWTDTRTRTRLQNKY